jgi:hypothetical protein
MLVMLKSTDIIELVSGSTSALDVVASFMDASTADPPVVKGSTSDNQVTAISSATTTTVVAAPAASTLRTLKGLTVRNKGAATNDVTIQLDKSATNYELYKTTLQPGQTLEFIEGIGFFVPAASRLLAFRRVTADVINATTSFADVTGLTVPVATGKQYCFESHLYHMANATTSGAFWAVNGPTMTGMRLNGIDVVTGGVASSAIAAPVADITARDTNLNVETTSAITPILAILSGWINPSADGTFAIRFASEVAVAAGITVKVGSWLQMWESEN